MFDTAIGQWAVVGDSKSPVSHTRLMYESTNAFNLQHSLLGASSPTRMFFLVLSKRTLTQKILCTRARMGFTNLVVDWTMSCLAGDMMR